MLWAAQLVCQQQFNTLTTLFIPSIRNSSHRV